MYFELGENWTYWLEGLEVEVGRWSKEVSRAHQIAFWLSARVLRHWPVAEFQMRLPNVRWPPGLEERVFCDLHQSIAGARDD